MSLTAEQLRLRKGKLTASRVKVLMDGGDQELYDLWRELTGDPSYEQPDLSGIWAVRLGEATETLNLDWYEHRTGRPLTRRGEVVTSQERPWAAATLDGFDASRPDGPAVVETKHVVGFEPFETIVARYMPQVHWQMYVTGAPLAVLSVIEGARVPRFEEVPLDLAYLAELLRRAHLLWQCVETLTPPVVLPPVEPPKPAIREVDMASNREWLDFAGSWIRNRDAAKEFDKAAKELKKLAPADAKRVHGHGVEVKRSSNGALRIGAIE